MNPFILADIDPIDVGLDLGGIASALASEMGTGLVVYFGLAVTFVVMWRVWRWMTMIEAADGKLYHREELYGRRRYRAPSRNYRLNGRSSSGYAQYLTHAQASSYRNYRGAYRVQNRYRLRSGSVRYSRSGNSWNGMRRGRYRPARYDPDASLRRFRAFQEENLRSQGGRYRGSPGDDDDMPF